MPGPSLVSFKIVSFLFFNFRPWKLLHNILDLELLIVGKLRPSAKRIKKWIIAAIDPLLIWDFFVLGPVSRKPGNFSGSEICFVFVVFACKIKVLICLKKIQWNFQLTGVWARNCATIQHFLILKFAFGPEKFPDLSRNEPIFVMQRVNPSLFLSLPLPLSLSLFDLALFCELFWNCHVYYS